MLLLFSYSICSNSQTFYLSSTATPDISPAFSQHMTWTVTTGAIRRTLSTTKDGSTMTSTTSAQCGGTSRPTLIGQFTSVALAANTYTNLTLRLSIRNSVNNTGASTVAQAIYTGYIVNASGTKTGGLFNASGTSTGTNFSTSLTNKSLAAFTLATVGSPLTIADNERIVIEVGWILIGGGASTRTGTESYGSDSGSDLPDDNSTTTADNPVLVFTGQTLTFYTPAAPTVKPLSAMGVGVLYPFLNPYK